MRYNTTLNLVEIYDDETSQWVPTGKTLAEAAGGTITNITQRNVNYRVHTFSSVGRYNFTMSKSGQVEYLIVAGGGGGGMPNMVWRLRCRMQMTAGVPLGAV